MKKKLNIPAFKNEDEEFEFFSNLDLSEYFDAADFKPAFFPLLKPSTRTITLRMPEYLLEKIRIEANSRDIPYQSLIKTTLHNAFYGRMLKA